MEYQRLTIRDNIGCFKYDLKDFKHKIGEFGDYDAFFAYSMAVKRLGEIEEKIENGTLVELPCKVGDTVWTINCWQEYGKKELGEPYSVTRYELHENKCSCIEINDKNCYRGEISIIAREKYKGITPYVFLTKAEAEAKLRELKGERKCR